MHVTGMPTRAAEQLPLDRRKFALVRRSFAQGVDVLTVEIEHIDASALEDVAQNLSVDVEPTPGTLRLIQVGLASCRLWSF